VFYSPEDIALGKPTTELKSARGEGRFEDDSWRIRKDGSSFWANVVVTPLRDDAGRLRGFVKITRDVTEKRKAEQEIVQRSLELEAANKELEAFSYSVSHDLRAPLRGIDGFSQALQEDYQQQLDSTGKDYLQRICTATKRMGELIDDLLNLARVARAEIYRERIDLSKLADEVAREFQSQEPGRSVALNIAAGLEAEGDSRLLRVALQNLIGNAWKFTSKREKAQIEFGAQGVNGGKAYFVRDNGAGFEQSYASRLFGAFQRLHAASEFPGTGIGLATVQRIIRRHGGTVWAEGTVNQGATVYFTLGRPNT
jgi:light-regulated signal transduction histidine kinase (bacteriophytochrome)